MGGIAVCSTRFMPSFTYDNTFVVADSVSGACECADTLLGSSYESACGPISDATTTAAPATTTPAPAPPSEPYFDPECCDYNNPKYLSIGALSICSLLGKQLSF